MMTVTESKMWGERNTTQAEIKGSLKLDGLCVDILVLDEREVYGRHDYLVIPVMGEGKKWVAASKVELV